MSAADSGIAAPVLGDHAPNEVPLRLCPIPSAIVEQEMDLRRQVERVAAQRRALPPAAKSRRTMFSRRRTPAANRSA